MATVASPKPALSAFPRDRAFYTGISVALAVVVFVGFARTYYLSSFFGTSTTISGGSFTPIVHVHGAVFTAWVLLFLVQTALIAERRVAVHRKLGVAGGVLASVMVVVGVVTAVIRAKAGAAPPGVDPLTFLAFPLGDMLMFATFISAALRWRRDKEKHKRLMLLAYVSLMAAPIARWPGALAMGPLAFSGFALMFVVAGVIYDAVTRRRVHPAYLWGGALLLSSVPLRLAISSSHAWHSFAEFLVGRLAAA